MRVRNKELRERRHRKEQRIKDLIKEAKADAKAGNKPKVAAAKPAAPAKKAPVKVEKAEKVEKVEKVEAVAATPAVEATEKPKKAPAKKKEAPAAE